MPALRPLTCLLAGSASLLSLMPGLVAPVSAADFREQYGRYSPAPAPHPDLNVTEEVQIERRLPAPPVAASPEPQCRAFTKRHFNEFGEVVIRRIRICEEVVRGPGIKVARRAAASRSLWATHAANQHSFPAAGR